MKGLVTQDSLWGLRSVFLVAETPLLHRVLWYDCVSKDRACLVLRRSCCGHSVGRVSLQRNILTDAGREAVCPAITFSLTTVLHLPYADCGKDDTCCYSYYRGAVARYLPGKEQFHSSTPCSGTVQHTSSYAGTYLFPSSILKELTLVTRDC